MIELVLLVLGCSAATYLWRGLGVLLSGRVRADSQLFLWIACVAYAMIAGLVTRIVMLPTGALAATLLADRLLACAVALAAYYVFRRNLFAGISAGFAAILIAMALR